MEIVSSGCAGRAGRFREQQKHSAAILRIEKGPQAFFDNLRRAPFTGRAVLPAAGKAAFCVFARLRYNGRVRNERKPCR